MNQYANEAIRGCLQGQLLSDFCEEWTCFTGEQITAIFYGEISQFGSKLVVHNVKT